MSLTGGTKDVNPQILKKSFAMTSDTNLSVEVPLPVQRLNNKNRSMVMEILRVGWTFDANDGATHTHLGIATQAAPSGTTAFKGNEGYIIQFHKRYNKIVGPDQVQNWFDLTDGQGHGVLVATDKIYLIANGGASNTKEVLCEILYRWKNVSLQEYIGIVQAATL